MIADSAGKKQVKRNYFYLLKGWFASPYRPDLTPNEQLVFLAILHLANQTRFLPILEVEKCALASIACVCKDTLRKALVQLGEYDLIFVEPSHRNLNTTLNIIVNYDLLEGKKTTFQEGEGQPKTDNTCDDDHHDGNVDKGGQAKSSSHTHVDGRNFRPSQPTYPQPHVCEGNSQQIQVTPGLKVDRSSGFVMPRQGLGQFIETTDIDNDLLDGTDAELRKTLSGEKKEFQDGDTCPKCRRFTLKLRFKTNMNPARRDSFFACTGYKFGECRFTAHHSSKHFTPKSSGSSASPAPTRPDRPHTHQDSPQAAAHPSG